MNDANEMVCICREVDKNSGKIAVYPINAPVTDELLHKLSLRTRLNPELRYFATMRIRWEGLYHDDILKALRRKAVTKAALERLGGIVEL